jgi:hypothetical protein
MSLLCNGSSFRHDLQPDQGDNVNRSNRFFIRPPEPFPRYPFERLSDYARTDGSCPAHSDPITLSSWFGFELELRTWSTAMVNWQP